MPQDISKTPRTATEQLLLTQATDKIVPAVTIPMSASETVYVEVSGLQNDRMENDRPASSWDLNFIREAVADRLGELGYRLRKHPDEATYMVRVVVQSFGTTQSTAFFGMPPIQSIIIPFALPQITLYQAQHQSGYLRFALHVLDRESGRFLHATPWYLGKTFHNQYTLLLFVSFVRTDLVDVP